MGARWGHGGTELFKRRHAGRCLNVVVGAELRSFCLPIGEQQLSGFNCETTCVCSNKTLNVSQTMPDGYIITL